MANAPERSPEMLQARRRIYLRNRIPALREEHQNVTRETQELAQQIRGEGEAGAKTEQAKKLREQLIYLQEHGEWLRTHLKSLAQERKTFVERRLGAAPPLDAPEPAPTPAKKRGKT